MATQIYKTKDLLLQDGETVTVKPLTIGPLRYFMKAWNKFSEADNDDQGFDVYVNCSGIALEENYRDKYDQPRANAAEQKKGSFLNPEYKAHLEEVLDLETIYEILDIAGGIKLNDPKAIQEALELAQAQTESE